MEITLEFDGIFDRAMRDALGTLADADLIDHCERHGRSEGRLSTQQPPEYTSHVDEGH